MNLLLDTHVFLWLAADPSLLPGNAHAALEAEENDLFLSSISVWEIEQKFRLGKLRLHVEPRMLVAEFYEMYDIRPLSFEEESVFMLGKLPLLHGDPFDRMLICQAIQHNMTIVSGDRHIHQYPVSVIW